MLGNRETRRARALLGVVAKYPEEWDIRIDLDFVPLAVDSE
jgi:hypothetical protein